MLLYTAEFLNADRTIVSFYNLRISYDMNLEVMRGSVSSVV